MALKKDVGTRFWSKVDRRGSDECWPWTGSIDGYGRGNFHLNGRTAMAYRVAAQLSGLQIAKGQCVCHRCDNPKCCNPAHLFLGTQADNMADMWGKGRGVPPIPPPTVGIRYPRKSVDQVHRLARTGLSQAKQSNVSRILSGNIRRVL